MANIWSPPHLIGQHLAAMSLDWLTVSILMTAPDKREERRRRRRARRAKYRLMASQSSQLVEVASEYAQCSKMATVRSTNVCGTQSKGW